MMMWLKASQLAKRLGVCNATAMRYAKRKGLEIEERPVRGGMAFFINYNGEMDGVIGRKQEAYHRMKQRPDPERLARCLDIIKAMNIDFDSIGMGKVISALYETLP